MDKLLKRGIKMSIDVFNEKVSLIRSYASKLKREGIPLNHQLILIRSYASNLKINLTNSMINEVLF